MNRADAVRDAILGHMRAAIAIAFLATAIAASVFSLGDQAHAQASLSVKPVVSPAFLVLGEGDSETINVRMEVSGTASYNLTATLSVSPTDANVSISPSSQIFNAAVLNLGASANFTVTANQDSDQDDTRAVIRIAWSGTGYDNGSENAVVIHVADDDNDGLVSNWLQQAVNISSARIAQRFTTGSNSEGYDITSIATVLGGAAAGPGLWDTGNFEMVIRANDNGNIPGTIIATMRNPSSFSVHESDTVAGDINRWLAPSSGLHLRPNTTYWVDVGQPSEPLLPPPALWRVASQPDTVDQ